MSYPSAMVVSLLTPSIDAGRRAKRPTLRTRRRRRRRPWSEVIRPRRSPRRSASRLDREQRGCWEATRRRTGQWGTRTRRLARSADRQGGRDILDIPMAVAPRFTTVLRGGTIKYKLRHFLWSLPEFNGQ